MQSDPNFLIALSVYKQWLVEEAGSTTEDAEAVTKSIMMDAYWNAHEYDLSTA